MNARILIKEKRTTALSQTEAGILMEVVHDVALQGVAVIRISPRVDQIFEN